MTFPEIQVIPKAFDGKVDFKDGPAIDGFGRQRVSNPERIWDSQFEYNLHPLFYDAITDTNGTVTHNAAFSAATLTVTTDSGSTAIIQTFEYLRYQPGKSQQVVMTFLMASAIASLDQRVGQFDAENGFFFEVTGTTVNLVRRTKTSGSVVNNKTAQASWNIDVMDGTGPSGKTLDLTTVQILHIDYQWLSTGRIRYGFDIDGVVRYVHQELIANTLDVPSTTTANLPVRWEMDTTGAIASQSVMQAICVSVISEGGLDIELGHTFTGGNSATFITGIGTAAKNLFSVRPATTLNSITNRAKVNFTSLDIFADDAMLWEIIYKPDSITGDSFSSPVTHSSVEVDVAGTAVVNGIPVASGYIAASNKGGLASIRDLNSKFPFALDAAGTDQSRGFTVQVRTLGGTNKQAAGQLNWEEVR